MHITTIAIILHLAANSLQYPVGLSTGVTNQAQDDTVTQAIRGLWSRHDSIRVAAKTKILTVGTIAIDPLVSLLSELLETIRKPHIVAGQRRLEPSSESPSGYEPREGITWRVIYDCCELLGRLKAYEAVALLIQVIEVDDVPLMLPRLLPEINALILIGKPAESALIEEMKNAFQKAGSLVGQKLPDGDERKLLLQERKASDIQIQVGVALQMIGDNSTIEALEALMKSEAYLGRSARDIIEHTMARIRTRKDYR